MNLQSVMQQILRTTMQEHLTIRCHLYIRLDILLHKTLSTGTHLSFHATSRWLVICSFVLPVGPYHASILHPPQALVLKNIQRVCSKVNVPVPQNMKKETKTGISPALGLNKSTLWPIQESPARAFHTIYTQVPLWKGRNMLRTCIQHHDQQNIPVRLQFKHKLIAVSDLRQGYFEKEYICKCTFCKKESVPRI